MEKKIFFRIPFLIVLLTILVSASCRKIIVTPENESTDNIVIRDSIVIKDSLVTIYDTVFITDTIAVLDTIPVTDTTIYHDTLTLIDTIRKVDTIRYLDTIWTEKVISIIDTIIVRDTLTRFDTIQVIDTIRVFDSIKVYDTIKVTVPLPRPVPNDTEILVGTGSGSLTINGDLLIGTPATTIRIKGGAYATITIRDLDGTRDKPITILNEGVVAVRNEMVTRDITNVTISGAGSTNSDRGFVFENLSYRAIRMSGKMTGVTLQNMYFRNVANYCIAGEPDNGANLPYDGTANTRTERFKILNCFFDNVGSIVFGGQLNQSGDTGFFKDVEIAYNDFRNSEAGSLISFLNVQDYDIHHNVIDNVNQKNDNHNGIFFMEGNGHFHHNKLTNYQGNAIRAWIYSRGSTPAVVLIHNNICYNTRRYGGFEIQEFSRHLVAGKTTYAHAKVYNNTVGRMNTSRIWEGQLLDLYNTSGTLEYYNNLGFDLYSNNTYKPISDMINNMSNTKITVNSNNRYFVNQVDAVYTDLASKHSNIGAVIDF